MTKTKASRTALAAVVFGAGIGLASTAMAVPTFDVDPNGIPGVTEGEVFTADFVNGGSSTRVVLSGGNGVDEFTYTANGYITYQGFQLESDPIGAGTSRLTVDYGLYATFVQTFTCGSALAVGVSCDVTSADISVYADPGFTNDFDQATLGADPSVTDNGTADILLGTADTVISGTAGINEDGGAFENVTTNFSLTAAGSSYFIDPVPFYSLAFSNFNNTAQGLTISDDGTVFAIVNENGGTDFNSAAVPEPAVLALFGLGLLGMAGVSRRRRS